MDRDNTIETNGVRYTVNERGGVTLVARGAEYDYPHTTIEARLFAPLVREAARRKADQAQEDLVVLMPYQKNGETHFAEIGTGFWYEHKLHVTLHATPREGMLILQPAAPAPAAPAPAAPTKRRRTPGRSAT